jgi:pyridoxine 5-phosphate synthase
MAKLSVNVNKIALIRNARGKNIPDLLKVSYDAISFGAHGITVHPRPDQRHIKIQDVHELNHLVREMNVDRPENSKVEFNIEGYPTHDFIQLIETVNPDQCTLVPDAPDALTSNAGWNIKKNLTILEWSIGRLRSIGVRSSLFVDVNTLTPDEIEALLTIKPDRVELYTEAYAEAFPTAKKSEVLEKYKTIALQLYDLGFGINAGHDLNLNNIESLIESIPFIDEVSIGHALVSEALYQGLENVIKQYVAKLS